VQCILFEKKNLYHAHVYRLIFENYKPVN